MTVTKIIANVKVERKQVIANPEEILKNYPEVEGAAFVVGEYRFRLKGIAMTITLRFLKDIETGIVSFEQSHYIHTPTQMGPYITSRPSNDDETRALNQALFGFRNHYEGAVAAGHVPNDSWLVPNEDF
jgi:hypothetical protein